MDWQVDVPDDADEDEADVWPGKPQVQPNGRKRRGRRGGNRNILDGDEDEDYDEYRPEGNDSQAEVAPGIPPEPTGRQRRRAARTSNPKHPNLDPHETEDDGQVAAAEADSPTPAQSAKRTSKRGGARPGAGRKPKRPKPARTTADDSAQAADDSDDQPLMMSAKSVSAAASVTAEEPVEVGRGAVLPRTSLGTPAKSTRKRKAAEMADSGSEAEDGSFVMQLDDYGRGGDEDEDDEDDDEYDDVERAKRERRKPLRYRV